MFLKPARGFTLVEILIVLAIAGFAIAIVVPGVSRYIERSRVLESVVDIGTMSTKIKQYEASTGALPATLADVGYGGKTDPWGNAYEYINLVTASGNGQARKDKKLAPLNSDFDLYSIGGDKETSSQLSNAKSRDDVVRARNGGFIGLAADFDP